MRKTLILSVLVLCMSLGLAWSDTSSSAPNPQQLRELEIRILGPSANATPAASCTLTCPNDPVSCTSTSGNCRWLDVKGFVYAVCDDQWHFCPNGWGW
jgi:hypothetical protein